MNEPGTIPVGELHDYFSKIGTEGGKSTSEAKILAAKANGLAGGRPRHVYIYGLLNLDTGRVEYIGQTEDIRRRLRGHISGSGRKANPIPFQIGVVVLCKTDENHANECEQLFYEHYKKHGQCSMNGEKYVPYWARTPKWLPDSET